MTEFLLQLLDWIYKKNCYLCNRVIDDGCICQSCYDKIEIYYPEPVKEILGIKIFAACSYQNEVQKLIRAIKYHNKKAFAGPLAQILYEYWSSFGSKKCNYLVVPVPLYKKRQQKRGYNQMELISIEFSKMAGYSFSFELIKRIKDTKPQYKLTLNERRENLKDAFRLELKNYNKEPILLLDDISTTGSTFEQIIKEFHKANIYDITALAIAVPVSASKFVH